MNAYAELGVADGSTLEICRRAYYRLASIYHPDHGGHREDFERIAAAWRAIQDGHPFGSDSATEGADSERCQDDFLVEFLLQLIADDGVMHEIQRQIPDRALRGMLGNFIRGHAKSLFRSGDQEQSGRRHRGDQQPRRWGCGGDRPGD